MNFILSPLAIYATIAAGWIALLALVISGRIEQAREQKRSADAAAALRETVAQLSAQLSARMDELAADARERAVPSGPPPSAINLNKRWEALRMFRHGADPHTIAGALGVPLPEVSLLHTVHGIMAEHAAYPARSSQAFSSRREYSPDA